MNILTSILFLSSLFIASTTYAYTPKKVVVSLTFLSTYCSVNTTCDGYETERLDGGKYEGGRNVVVNSCPKESNYASVNAATCTFPTDTEEPTSAAVTIGYSFGTITFNRNDYGQNCMSNDDYLYIILSKPQLDERDNSYNIPLTTRCCNPDQSSCNY